MQSRTFLTVVCVLILSGLAGCSGSDCCDDSKQKTSAYPELTGPYLGQTPPGSEAELFAPGVVSTGLFTRDFAVAADGLELFFTVAYSGGSSIMTAREIDGRWTEPEVAAFSGKNRDFEPFLSHDGSRLYFLSNRPPEGQPEKPGWAYQNIWFSQRSETGWGEATMLAPPINSEANEFFPSLTLDGTIYFTRGTDPQHAAIFRSRLEDGEYQQVERLPDEVNGVDSQYNAFIAADESLLLFSTADREDSLGGSDCYVSFRTNDDAWSTAVNLGPTVNDEGNCDSAMLTPDGKYLFFMSTRRDPALDTPLTGLSFGELRERLSLPGNGSADIYWVDATILDGLRSETSNHEEG